MHPRMRAALLLFAVAVAACAKNLPVGPSELTAGIIIYEDNNFGGGSAHVSADISDLNDFGGPCVQDSSGGSVTKTWGDCISSVRVAPGWRATLYGNANYDGASLEITADVPALSDVPGGCRRGMNDCVSSILLSRR